MDNQEITKVIFRVWSDDKDIIALFPEIAADNFGYLCSSYMHVGQHGAADTGIVNGLTRPATESEFADLKAELESIGYVLEIRKRVTPAMRAALRSQRI